MDSVYALRQHGDAAGAVNTAVALMRTGRMMRIQGSTLMDYLVGQAIETYAINYWLRPGQNHGRVTANLARLDNLAGIAHGGGLEAIAQETMAEFNSLHKLRGKQQPSTPWPGGNASVLFADSVLQRIMWWTALSASVLVPVWILSGLAAIWARRRHVELVTPSRLDLSLASFAPLLGLLAVLALDIRCFYADQDSIPGPDLRAYAWASVPLDSLAPALTRALPFVFLLLIGQACAARALKARSSSEPNWREQARRLGAGPNCLHAFLFRAIPILIQLTIALLFLVFVVCFGYYFPDHDSSPNTYLQYVFWAWPAIAALRVLSWVFVSKKRAAIFSCLTLLAQAIPTFFLIMGVLLGIAILAISPACAVYQSHYQTTLSIGEWPFYKSLMGL
jgi:hypothetical protein